MYRHENLGISFIFMILYCSRIWRVDSYDNYVKIIRAYNLSLQ